MLLRAGEVLEQVAELVAAGRSAGRRRSRCGSGRAAPLAPGLPEIGDQRVLRQRPESATGSSAVATMSMSLQVSAQRRAEPARTTRSEAAWAVSASTSCSPASRTSASRRRSSSPSVVSLSIEASTFSSNFAPRPADVPELLVLGRRPQLLERADAGLVVDPPRGLGADAGEPRDLDERGREPLLQLAGRGDLALVEQRDDLLLDRLADPLELGRLPGARELGDRARGCRGSPERPPCRRARGSGWRRRARRGSRAR